MSFMDMLGALASGGPLERIGSDDVDGLTVSTVLTVDMGYETAICDENGAHPVERYSSKAEAERGHVAWKERAATLGEITKLGYGDFVQPRPLTLKRAR